MLDNSLAVRHIAPMDALSTQHFETAKQASLHLDAASNAMRILSAMSWDTALKDKFLKSGTLPRPEYKTVDTQTARVSWKPQRI